MFTNWSATNFFFLPKKMSVLVNSHLVRSCESPFLDPEREDKRQQQVDLNRFVYVRDFLCLYRPIQQVRILLLAFDECVLAAARLLHLISRKLLSIGEPYTHRRSFRRRADPQ